MSDEFSKMIKLITDFLKKYYIFFMYFILGIISTFLIELISRGSIKSTMDFIINNRDVFIINYLIILLFISPMLLIKKGFTIFGVIFQVLIIASGINLFVLNFRGYPMTFWDIYSLRDGLSILENYINCKYILGIIILIVFMYLFFKLLLKLDRKNKVNLKLIFRIVPVFIVVIIYIPYMNNLKGQDKLRLNHVDLKTSYNNNGFIYSYLESYFSLLKNEPENYTKNNLLEIEENLNNNKTENSFTVKPNIIFLQLESVMDLSNIDILGLTGNPMPNFTKLSEEYSSGILKVPTIGGGTVRTEFEVLTSYSNDYLSPGQIAHTSILKYKQVDSIASYLNSYNYEASLIHNYRGNFYDRNIAYKNLGFNRFIPIEYMYNTEGHPNYPKDFLLLANIKKVLNNSENPQFIYSIGVQTHGPYNSEYNAKNSIIKVTGNIDEELKNQAQDYVDRLVEVDTFIGNTIKYLEELNKPVILVVFSDHLPALKKGSEKYISGDKQYETKYFIYDNIGLEKNDEDIEAYELSSKVLSLLNLNGNRINQVYNLYRNDSSYKEIYELVQYDMLYGKGFISNTESKFSNEQLKMGIEHITIKNVNIANDYVEVKGQFFNKFSSIYINGKKVETEYIDQATLRYNEKVEKIKKVQVKQLGMYDKVLGETEEYIIEKE